MTGKLNTGKGLSETRLSYSKPFQFCSPYVPELSKQLTTEHVRALLRVKASLRKSHGEQKKLKITPTRSGEIFHKSRRKRVTLQRVYRN
jgi:hypothetical protein